MPYSTEWRHNLCKLNRKKMGDSEHGFAATRLPHDDSCEHTCSDLEMINCVDVNKRQFVNWVVIDNDAIFENSVQRKNTTRQESLKI